MRIHELFTESKNPWEQGMPRSNPQDIMNRGEPVDTVDTGTARMNNPDIMDPVERAEQSLDRESLKRLVQQGVKLLTPEQKEVLYHVLWDELPVYQIAEKMKITAKRVNVLMNQAVTRLRNSGIFDQQRDDYSE